jgi:hypothetical protein
MSATTEEVAEKIVVFDNNDTMPSTNYFKYISCDRRYLGFMHIQWLRGSCDNTNTDITAPTIATEPTTDTTYLRWMQIQYQGESVSSSDIGRDDEVQIKWMWDDLEDELVPYMSNSKCRFLFHGSHQNENEASQYARYNISDHLSLLEIEVLLAPPIFLNYSSITDENVDLETEPIITLITDTLQQFLEERNKRMAAVEHLATSEYHSGICA